MRAGQIQLGVGGWQGWGRGGVSLWRDGNQAAEEVTSPPAPALPLHLLLCGFFFGGGWGGFYLQSLCPSSHTSTRWPVRIKIKPLEASSCQTTHVLLLHLGSLICIMCENLPGTLQEFTTETQLKRLENRSHDVYYPPNFLKKGQIINILDFEVHTVFVATTQLCCSNAKVGR